MTRQRPNISRSSSTDTQTTAEAPDVDLDAVGDALSRGLNDSTSSESDTSETTESSTTDTPATDDMPRVVGPIDNSDSTPSESDTSETTESSTTDTPATDDMPRVVESTPEATVRSEAEEQIANQAAEQLRTKTGRGDITAADVALDTDNQTAKLDQKYVAEQRQLQAAATIQGVTDTQARQRDLLESLSTAQDIQRGRQMQAARETATKQLEQQLAGPLAGLVDLSDQIRTDVRDGQIVAKPTESLQTDLQSGVSETLINQLEDKTNANLDREDVEISETEDGYSARLSEEGQKSVEVQKTPGSDIPIVGGLSTTGTRIRQDIRDVTDPAANWWEQNTPSKKDVLGVVGAAAPVAAAEPTIGGEVALGTLAGVGLGAAALQQRGNVLTGDDPSATATSVGLGDFVTREEIESPEQPADEIGELPLSDGTTTELTISDGQQQVELDIPQEDNGSVTGTGDEISVPVSTAMLGQQQQVIDEQESDRITQDDIVTDLPEPDQPAPSTRERQRREDLTTPERTFPTGSSAVVGRGDFSEQTQDRMQEAGQTIDQTQQTEPTVEGASQTTGPLAQGVERQNVLSRELADISSRVSDQLSESQTAMPSSMLDSMQQLRTASLSQTLAEQSTTQQNNVITDTQTDYQTMFDEANEKQSKGRLRLPSNDDDDMRFELADIADVDDKLFSSGILSAEDILQEE